MHPCQAHPLLLERILDLFTGTFQRLPSKRHSPSPHDRALGQCLLHVLLAALDSPYAILQCNTSPFKQLQSLAAHTGQKQG